MMVSYKVEVNGIMVAPGQGHTEKTWVEEPITVHSLDQLVASIQRDWGINSNITIIVHRANLGEN